MDVKPQRKIDFPVDRDDFEKRFRVNLETGCWEWKRIKNPKLYGQYKGFPAHRVAWLIYRGDDPQGSYVLHQCDNRRCVNPSHLYLGTQSDNLGDMWKRRRRLNNAGTAKHSWEMINEIRRLYQTGNYSQAELARRFGINRSMVFKIVNNQIWKTE